MKNEFIINLNLQMILLPTIVQTVFYYLGIFLFNIVSNRLSMFLYTITTGIICNHSSNI